MNDSLEAVTAELRQAGVPFRVDRGRKHPQVRFGAELDRVYVVAGSASDWRASRNARADIRRMLKEMGR